MRREPGRCDRAACRCRSRAECRGRDRDVQSVRASPRSGDRKTSARSSHVLTNGRMFFYRRFAEKLGRIEHPDLVLGMPLYSDIDTQHDHIVQARGAFEETVIGLMNLDRYHVRVEIRVVLHALSIPRLPQFAAFIARNLPFACHVAMMGLEMFGLVHQHLAELWIDPLDYQRELIAACDTLCDAGISSRW